MRRVTLLAQTGLAAGLTLLAPGAARGQTSYSIQRIFQAGDSIGDIDTVEGDRYFSIGTLNDSGRLVFALRHSNAPRDTLVLYADGKLTPIVAAGKAAPVPGGAWPSSVFVTGPVSMNQLGNIAFAAGGPGSREEPDWDTFLWEAKAQAVIPVALKGMPAVNNLTFEAGGAYTPRINNNNEIAFPARIKNGAGQIRTGIFFRRPSGELLALALPDQALPNGGTSDDAGVTSINDAGATGFVAKQQGKEGFSGYVWEKGTITPVAAVGTQAPGGGEIADVRGLWVNNKNASVLVGIRLQSGERGLYRFADGKLAPVAVKGQVMPDGATLIQPRSTSYANTAGEHAFLATLTGGATAAYRVDADGKLSLILKSGATTELGTIRQVGGDSDGTGFNARGQVALPVSLVGGSDMVVLLTPTAP
jgi:hypothetical protein